MRFGPEEFKRNCRAETLLIQLGGSQACREACMGELRAPWNERGWAFFHTCKNLLLNMSSSVSLIPAVNHNHLNTISLM